jgi:hypothetical protein
LRATTILETLKSKVHKSEAVWVDLYFNTLEVENHPLQNLIILKVPGRPITPILQKYGYALSRCFEGKNVRLVKGKRTEWINKAKDYKEPEKEQEKPKEMWWQL